MYVDRTEAKERVLSQSFRTPKSWHSVGQNYPANAINC